MKEEKEIDFYLTWINSGVFKISLQKLYSDYPETEEYTIDDLFFHPKYGVILLDYQEKICKSKVNKKRKEKLIKYYTRPKDLYVK